MIQGLASADIPNLTGRVRMETDGEIRQLLPWVSGYAYTIAGLLYRAPFRHANEGCLRTNTNWNHVLVCHKVD